MFVFAVVWLENNFICLCKGGVGWYKTKWRPFPSHHSRTSIIWLTTSGTPSGSSGFIALKIQAYENIPYFQVYFVHCFVQVSIPSFRALELSKGWMLLFLSPVRRTSSVEGRGEGKEGGGESISVERLQAGEILLTSIQFPARSPSRAFTELRKPLQFTAAFTCNVSLWEQRYNCTPG